ncbi:MAG: RNA methyltransferase, partial [Desulfarculales bacterium]|nr:RNA methyltransferase [Desulfarculales bacterium]
MAIDNDCLTQNMLPVLVSPRFPENIGAVARVCANMGLGPMRLVAPERLWPVPMERLATPAGRPWLESLSVYPDLASALADCLLAAGASARVGRDRGFLTTPRQAAPHILARAALGRVALVFGPEDTGLTTGDLDLCSFTVTIPTAGHASLNLSQAVMVLAYEMRLQALAQAEPEPARIIPAPLEEQLSLRQHLQQAFAAIKVINPENPEHFMRPYKLSLERAGLSRREVRAW